MWVSSPIPLFFATLPSALSVSGWVLLLLAIVWGLRATWMGASTISPWGWWALLAAILLIFRWPLIQLPQELYPDESQLIAGAITLRHDPVFWRSVDGGTAGPLDYYVLLPAAVFPGTDAYAVTRLTAALLIWGTLVAAGETLVLITNRAVVRIAVLPALAFEAFTTSAEFVPYSTELLPGLLLALAVLLSVRQSIQPSRSNLWAAALLLGATPFAKLQAAPLAAVLGLLLVTAEIASGRTRNAVLLTGVALLPTLLFTALVTVTGQTESMVISYFLQNVLYAQSGRLPASQVALILGQQSVTNGYHALWLAGSAVFCAGATVWERHAPRRLRNYHLAAAGLLALALFCVFSPGRPYHHYLNFLTLPLTLLMGTALGLALQPPAGGTPKSRRAISVGLFLACGLAPQLVLRVSGRPDPYEYYNTQFTAPSPAHHQLVTLLKSLSRPGDSLGIWGWRSSLYVEAGLPQATRVAHIEHLFVVGPWQKYYLRRYFEDLVTSLPPVFVDATGPGNFRFDRRSSGHEIYPSLRDWIRTNYRSVGEIDGVRLYVRLDRLPSAQAIPLPSADQGLHQDPLQNGGQANGRDRRP